MQPPLDFLGALQHVECDDDAVVHVDSSADADSLMAIVDFHSTLVDFVASLLLSLRQLELLMSLDSLDHCSCFDFERRYWQRLLQQPADIDEDVVMVVIEDQVCRCRCSNLWQFHLYCCCYRLHYFHYYG